MSFVLNDTNVVQYLASHGLVQPQDVLATEMLGWGVSNVLVKVRTGTGCLVVKQSLAQLKVSEAWFADRGRIFREKECIEALAHLLPSGSLPSVYHEDRENFLFVMSCAPEPGANWKELLLQGVVNQEVAAKVGTVLGTIHRATGGDLALQRQFGDHQPFIQLRIDPYHWSTAKANPDVAAVIEREARRMLEVKTALVHGDYSPKNIIVSDGEVFLIDFEVVLYGNPVFDVAFMLNHLMLKAVYNAGIREEYFAAARAFLTNYYEQAPVPDTFERDVVKQLGCLMLARVDGKSPAEYIDTPKAKGVVRDIAKDLLRADCPDMAGAVTMIDARLSDAAVP